MKFIHRSFLNVFTINFKCSFFNSCRFYACKPPIGPPWNVLFFGTDDFALHSLKALWAKFNTGTILSDLGVVSKKSCLVRKFAEDERLTVYDWPLDAKSINSNYHIGMVVSFGNLIPEDIISSFPLGCINIHASLLPRWRGAAPIIHAVSNGDSETGITIMKIQPHKFDTGAIVRQYRIPIDPHETTKEVENKLGVCGSNLLMECLRDMPRCLDKAIPQPKEGITYAPKVNLSMSKINWHTMTAKNVYDLHRALYHLYPLSTTWFGHLVKLHAIHLEKTFSDSTLSAASLDNKSEEEKSKRSALDFLQSSYNKVKLSATTVDCGKFVYEKATRFLKVFCSDGNCIIVEKLSLGGKTIKSSDFYNGFLSKKSIDLWKFGS